MYDDYEAGGYEPLVMNLWENMETVVKVYARQYGFRVLRDPGTAWNLYNISGSIPLNYLIDPTGVVQYEAVGFDESSVRAYIENYLGVSEGKGGPAIRALGAAPSLATGPVVLRYTLRKSGAVGLKIYTSDGKLVQTLTAPGNAGANVVQWNLHNDAGAPVANGLYIYEIRQGSACQHAKVSVLR